MSTSLKQNQGHFAVVVEPKQQLGLNENSGLDGRLRTSVHDIEARINQARSVSRSSGPRPIDSLRSSIANLNFRRWRRVRFLISARSIGPAT
jgi:hypothetical protein